MWPFELHNGSIWEQLFQIVSRHPPLNDKAVARLMSLTTKGYFALSSLVRVLFFFCTFCWAGPLLLTGACSDAQWNSRDHCHGNTWLILFSAAVNIYCSGVPPEQLSRRPEALRLGVRLWATCGLLMWPLLSLGISLQNLGNLGVEGGLIVSVPAFFGRSSVMHFHLPGFKNKCKHLLKALPRLFWLKCQNCNLQYNTGNTICIFYLLLIFSQFASQSHPITPCH